MVQENIVAPPRIQQPQFVPELNGVRGLAILAVLLFHFGSLYLPPNPNLADKLMMTLFRFGWTGVDLFFVLSGFLITGILLDTKEALNYFRAFYVRRLLRIFPLYYGALIFIFWVLPVIKAATRHPDVSIFLPPSEQVWYWLHLSNWRTAFVPRAFLVTNFWTLSIEEQFYLVWPAAVAFCSKRFYVALCLMIIAIAVILRNAPYILDIQAAHDNFIYRLTPFRLDPLAFGALIAVLSRTRRWKDHASRIMYASGAMGFALIGMAVEVTRNVSPLTMPMIRVGYVGIGLVCTSIVIYAITQSGSSKLNSRLLRSHLLMSLGEYSYGIYIVHGMVRYYLAHYTDRLSFSNLRFFSLLTIVLGISVSYLVAYCSFHLFEQHFLKLKRLFPYSWRPLPVVSAVDV